MKKWYALKEKYGKQWLRTILVAMVILISFGIVIASIIIDEIDEKNSRKCKECNSDHIGGSEYCYVHDPHKKRYTHSGLTNRKQSSGNSSYSGTSGSGGSYRKSYKRHTYDSYDSGYDDVYMDGDYDYDRYDRDSDYASGVDDAIGDFDEDW